MKDGLWLTQNCTMVKSSGRLNFHSGKYGQYAPKEHDHARHCDKSQESFRCLLHPSQDRARIRREGWANRHRHPVGRPVRRAPNLPGLRAWPLTRCPHLISYIVQDDPIDRGVCCMASALFQRECSSGTHPDRSTILRHFKLLRGRFSRTGFGKSATDRRYQLAADIVEITIRHCRCSAYRLLPNCDT
jgi:hypothetical protein